MFLLVQKIKNINHRGFTIIELIIAVGIVALMAAMAITSINPAKRIGDANDAQREADLNTIAKAIEYYTADNGQLPTDFSVTNIAEGEKLVLCSSEASKTCDGQTETCLQIDDPDFLGEYLPNLPIDPTKSADTDTGYYITRGSGGAIVLGACNPYTSVGVVIPTQVPMAALVAECGDGDVDGDEVCDDGDTTTETQTCGNGTTENGTYCNATCTTEVVLTEICDDGDIHNEGCGDGVIDVAGTYCNATCTAAISIARTEYCDYIGFSHDCYDSLAGEWLTTSVVGYAWCDASCSRKILYCAS